MDLEHAPLLVGQEDINVLLLHLLRDATQDVDLLARPDFSENPKWMANGGRITLRIAKNTKEHLKHNYIYIYINKIYIYIYKQTWCSDAG